MLPLSLMPPITFLPPFMVCDDGFILVFVGDKTPLNQTKRMKLRRKRSSSSIPPIAFKFVDFYILMILTRSHHRLRSTQFEVDQDVLEVITEVNKGYSCTLSLGATQKSENLVTELQEERGLKAHTWPFISVSKKMRG
nr:hypothetical protein [Tanacetum cinerariifolium]